MGAVEVFHVNDLGAWDAPRGNYRMRFFVWVIIPIIIKTIQLPNARGKCSLPNSENLIVIHSKVTV